MNRTLLAIAIGCALVSGPVAADPETAPGQHVACGETFWLEAALRFAADGPARLYERYIDTGRCIELREGLSVQVLNYYGDDESRRVELIFRGRRYYAERSAIVQPL